MSEYPEGEGIIIDPIGKIQGANVENLYNSIVVVLCLLKLKTFFLIHIFIHWIVKRKS